jgi:hypothetical protein
MASAQIPNSLNNPGLRSKASLPLIPTLLPSLTGQYPLTPQETPARSRAFATAGRFARRFQVSQQSANPIAPDARTCAFDVRKTEITRLFADSREDEFGFRVVGTADRLPPISISCTPLFWFIVGSTQFPTTYYSRFLANARPEADFK